MLDYPGTLEEGGTGRAADAAGRIMSSAIVLFIRITLHRNLLHAVSPRTGGRIDFYFVHLAYRFNRLISPSYRVESFMRARPRYIFSNWDALAGTRVPVCVSVVDGRGWKKKKNGNTRTIEQPNARPANVFSPTGIMESTASIPAPAGGPERWIEGEEEAKIKRSTR